MAKAHFYEVLNQLEKSWNKIARQYVERERLPIPLDSFRISVHVDYENKRDITARIQAGPVNQIHIVYPQKNYRKTIMKVLDYIANPKVHRDSDLEEQIFNGSVIHELYTNAIWKRKNKSRSKNSHWRKISASKERLISKRREKLDYIATVKVVNTVIVKHKETSLSYVIIDKEGREVWDMLQEAFHSCELMVQEYLEEKEKEKEKRGKTDLVPISDIIKVIFPIEVMHSNRFLVH